MSLHSRLQVDTGPSLDERVRRPPSPASGNGHKAAGLPKHRRVVSDISRRHSQEPIPELFLGAPLQDDVNERRTLQTQWAEALKKVQSLGSHSSRWSGVVTDLGRPKSMTTQGSSRTLDQWNFYPGPSIKRESPVLENLKPDQTWKSQVGAAPDQTWKSQVAGAAPDKTWKSQVGAAPDQSRKSQVGAAPNQTRKSQAGAAPDQSWKSQVGAAPDQTRKSRRGGEGLVSSASDLVKGGYRSRITAPLENLDQPWTSQGGRAAYSSSSNVMKGGSTSRRSSVSTVLENLDQTDEVGGAATFSSSDGSTHDATEDQMPSRVHRTQSQRYGSVKAKPVLNKAVSMREGGAHADAVMEMAHAYSATVCGLPLALQCASCGRSLGVIVQGNPGVDIAFCTACRPPEAQWKTSARQKKKSGFVSICRRLLRLDRKN